MCSSARRERSDRERRAARSRGHTRRSLRRARATSTAAASLVSSAPIADRARAPASASRVVLEDRDREVALCRARATLERLAARAAAGARLRLVRHGSATSASRAILAPSSEADAVSRAAASAAPSRSRLLKRALIGRPSASGEMDETLLSKTLALPIFASDPLSSVAYATESALVVLVAASATAADLVFPISLAIAALLAIVVLSYRQTVQRIRDERRRLRRRARTTSARFPSLVAAAALLVDYVLTVAVSVAAGVLALTSAAPSLEPHKVGLSLALRRRS